MTYLRHVIYALGVNAENTNKTKAKQMKTIPMKYQRNLRVDGSKVYSYNTHVATITGGNLLVHGHWSSTTSKHVNHVAKEYGLEKVDSPKEETEPGGILKAVAMVAAFGAILTDSQKDKNDWQARMLKAGLGNRGLMMPENWEQLSEDEKERRLTAALGVIA